MNVSAFIWERVYDWGGRIVYGYPGDGVGGLDEAIERASASDAKKRLKYVQVRHEEMAAFMATGHAKFTGEVGVCYATSGPGAIHLLNGLYDAKMDHVPSSRSAVSPCGPRSGRTTSRRLTCRRSSRTSPASS